MVEIRKCDNYDEARELFIEYSNLYELESEKVGEQTKFKLEPYL